MERSRAKRSSSVTATWTKRAMRDPESRDRWGALARRVIRREDGPPGMTADRWIHISLILVGALLLAGAITYFVVPAQGLPGFMGFMPGSDVIRWKRGALCLVVGLVCLTVGLLQTRRDLGKNP